MTKILFSQPHVVPNLFHSCMKRKNDIKPTFEAGFYSTQIAKPQKAQKVL